jgi:hypothetical protein
MRREELCYVLVFAKEKSEKSKLFKKARIASRTRMSHFFYEKEILTWVRKEKQLNLIGENLSLRRRRIETLNAKRKRLPGLKDKSPDRF